MIAPILRFYLRAYAPLLAVCLWAAVLMGCEEDLNPITGTDFPYEVYGVLDATADTQTVRVFPIESRLAAHQGEPIDAVVTSTDLQSGAVYTWRDSLAAYGDGTYGYLFWAPIRPVGGHTYRIDVTRSDGAQSSAEVAVPRAPQATPAAIASEVVLPVQFGAASAQLDSVEVEYRVIYGCGPRDVESYIFPYDVPERLPGNPQTLDVRLSKDYQTMRLDLAFKGKFSPAFSFYPDLIYLRMVVTDAGWTPPGGVFDPEVLIEPGTMSNVENGFGFVGSGYSVGMDLQPSDAALEAAGFRSEKPSPAFPPCRPVVPSPPPPPPPT